MAEAATAASTSTGPSGSSTFIESSTAYHAGNTRYDDSDNEGGDDDDDEKLFAELDAELDMMEDESSFGQKGDEDTVANFDMAEFRQRRMEELRQE